MPRAQDSPGLGAQLRGLRESRGWSLREVAAKAGINHGYLSQLERGEVAEPAPSMLHKLAAGYDTPFVVLMQWAGYIESTDELSPNQVLALKYLGEDVSKDELEAIRAVLDVLRAKRAMYGPEEQLDGYLSPNDRRAIQRHALALLRRSDSLGVIPTPLERVMEVAQLVAAGEVSLDEAEKRSLRKLFGSLLDKALDRLEGVIHRRAREIWVQPGLHQLRKRFVLAHEIGHDVLPWQQELAYLDDAKRLRQDVRILYEREANQAAIELLAQGDALRREADDSPLTVALVSELSSKYLISLQATARRITEESRRSVAMAIRFRGRSGRLGPYHTYCSAKFQDRFGWATVALPVEAREAASRARQGLETEHFLASDLDATFVELTVETLATPYAVMALYRPSATGRSVRRFLSVG